MIVNISENRKIRSHLLKKHTHFSKFPSRQRIDMWNALPSMKYRWSHPVDVFSISLSVSEMTLASEFAEMAFSSSRQQVLQDIILLPVDLFCLMIQNILSWRHFFHSSLAISSQPSIWIISRSRSRMIRLVSLECLSMLTDLRCLSIIMKLLI